MSFETKGDRTLFFDFLPLMVKSANGLRAKIMSDLDIAEQRRPQDGRITVKTSSRMVDMGVKSWVIADALTGIIAQRLVRRICPHCIIEDEPTPHVLKSIGIYQSTIQAKKGAGCRKCNNTGYKGRLGIFEIFLVDNELRSLVRTNASESELIRSAKQSGMTTLLEDAMGKIETGLTTCEEVLRVFGPQNTIEIPCHNCDSVLDERYSYCPFCGASITRTCDTCHKFLATDWNYFPHCQSPVTAEVDPPAVPQ